MYAYIARQPILNADKVVVAYELLFRDGKSNQFPNIDPDLATSTILSQNHFTMGIDKIAANLPAYINFPAESINNNSPSFLDPKYVVIEILEDVEVTSNLIKSCKKLKEQGYKLALDDHDFDPKWQLLFPYVDIIKIDVLQFNIIEINKFIRSIKHLDITLLAEKVETLTQFEQLKTLGFTLFQGYFFAKPEVLKHKAITATKTNLLELIAQASKKSLDFAQVQAIFERDIGLTYKLLRFINSPSYGCAQKITSLKHAITFIGELELKKFIALLALSNLNDSKPTEIIRVSLTRAKFCELVSAERHDDENPPKSFLTGMLSLLDGLLDYKFDELMDMLPVHEEIKAALLGEANALATYLNLVIAAEQGNWNLTELLCEELNLPENFVADSYVEAIAWADGMLQSAD